MALPYKAAWLLLVAMVVFSITLDATGFPSIVIVRPRLLRKNNIRFLVEHCGFNKNVFRMPSQDLAYQAWQARIKKLTSLAELEDAFNFPVRVLLHEQDLKLPGTIQIQSHGGFVITTPSYTSAHAKKNISLEWRKGKLYINGCAYDHHHLSIRPIAGPIYFKDYVYPGAFILLKKDNTLYVINQLDIEEYVYCVLRWESWPGWPQEVNKALAITCRTYVISKALQAHKKKRVYHIKNTNIHQTYKGMHADRELKTVINETKGLILTHNKEPIEAMYDSCCGSIIPAHMSDVDFAKAPYLARSYRCDFCKPAKIFLWNAQYSLQEFTQLLNKAGYNLSQVHDIVISKRDGAGTVQEVHIYDSNKQVVSVTGKQFYSLCPDVKSFCYSIEKKDNVFYITGQGYGHHLGLCQWGARNMINRGWHYRSILAFYYPGASLMALKNSL